MHITGTRYTAATATIGITRITRPPRVHIIHIIVIPVLYYESYIILYCIIYSAYTHRT